MDQIGRLYRPPGESRSLLLQVTVGCSHNGCTFCGMYQKKRFRPKPLDVIAADLCEAAQLLPRTRRVFLCDGDALVLSTRRLLEILSLIRRHLPWVKRLGVYGDTRSIAKKTLSELEALREAGLGIVYHGVESGDDEVLLRINKGGTRAECMAMADVLRAADIQHAVMVMLGIGGRLGSRAHAHQTATLLSEIDPLFAAALTTMVVPGTALHAQQQQGEFTLPSKFELLEELRTIVSESELSWCQFSSSHPSNYLSLSAVLPNERSALLADIDAVLAARDESLLRPEHLRTS